MTKHPRRERVDPDRPTHAGQNPENRVRPTGEPEPPPRDPPPPEKPAPQKDE